MKKGSTKKLIFSGIFLSGIFLSGIGGYPLPPKLKIEAHQGFLASKSAKQLDAIHDRTVAIWTTYDVWTIAIWTTLDYKDIQTTGTFGLSPFGLFWTTGTFGLQGHLDY